MKEIEREQLIDFFKALNEGKETESDTLNGTIHSGILPSLSFLKINIQQHFKNTEKGNIELNSLTTQIELIEKLTKELRVIMSDLKPSLLKDFGLVLTFENYARKLSEVKGLEIRLKNDTSIIKGIFSYQEELNIFRAYDLIINYLLLNSDPEKVTIFLNILENQLYLEFVAGKSKRETTNEIDHFSNSEFKKIQARLILLNAKIGENSDWINFVQIIIPLKK